MAWCERRSAQAPHTWLWLWLWPRLRLRLALALRLRLALRLALRLRLRLRLGRCLLVEAASDAGGERRRRRWATPAAVGDAGRDDGGVQDGRGVGWGASGATRRSTRAPRRRRRPAHEGVAGSAWCERSSAQAPHTWVVLDHTRHDVGAGAGRARQQGGATRCSTGGVERSRGLCSGGERGGRVWGVWATHSCSGAAPIEPRPKLLS